MVYLDEAIGNIECGKTYKGELLRHFVINNTSYMILLNNGNIENDNSYKVTKITENVTTAMSERYTCNFKSKVTIVEIELVRE